MTRRFYCQSPASPHGRDGQKAFQMSTTEKKESKRSDQLVTPKAAWDINVTAEVAEPSSSRSTRVESWLALVLRPREAGRG
jgi:hypothetical protein